MGDAIKLVKNDSIKIRKLVSFNRPVTIALGWKTNRYSGREDFDLDLSLAVCDENNECLDMRHLIWFYNKTTPEDSIFHSGDNTVGDDEGDAETAKIIFAKLPDKAKYIHCFVTIYDAKDRKQNFGQVDDAYIRLLNENGDEKVRFEISEEDMTADKCSMEFAKFIRMDSGDDWEMKMVAEGRDWEIENWIEHFGLNLRKVFERYCK